MIALYFDELFANSGIYLRESMYLWKRGIDYEIGFWNNWFETRGAEWQDDFAARLEPQNLAPWLVKLLPEPAIQPRRVLDVGSGPITKTGHIVAGQAIELTATDPLANLYSRIMRKYSIVPPVETIVSFSEDISTRFPQDHFDLICCTNALDHAIEPVWGILEMLIVLKPARKIFLSHRRNEAVFENYSGFHQWNFDNEDGEFIIWNKQRRINVSRLLNSVATVEVVIVDDNITVTATKLAQLPIDPLSYQRALRANVLGLLIE